MDEKTGSIAKGNNLNQVDIEALKATLKESLDTTEDEKT